MKTKCVPLILFLVGLFAQVAVSQSIEYKQLENEFKTDDLSAENLASFEKRAIQKVKDYAGYIEIITNSSYDEAFRKQAVDMACNLFSDKNNLIADSVMVTGKNKLTAGNYFQKLFKTTNQKIKLSLSDIIISEPLKKEGKANYSGALTFIENVQLLDKNGQITKSWKGKKKVVFYLLKIEKEFGESKKYIWEIKLGNIS